MPIYFCFSDEQGKYECERNDRFLRAHPFYIRSNILFQGDDWKWLKQEISKLKTAYCLPEDKEIKWSHVWSIRSHQEKNKPISSKKGFYFLRNTKPEKIEDYIKNCISPLQELSNCALIYTVTSNRNCPKINEVDLLSMHLQESMQRLEMELQHDQDNLGIMFNDPVSESKDKQLREAYSQIVQSGDFIEDYAHIKDSLNLEYSHHSIGIQLADYLAGAFYSLLCRRPFGNHLFSQYISKILRCSKSGEIMGYGIREVPRNSSFRNRIRSIINTI